jgi:NADPH:quinone reductase
MTRGTYQFKPELPFSPGAEIAGVVDKAGPGVAGFTPGSRVMAYVNWGGAREKAIVPAGSLIAIPDAIDDVTAAGLIVTYGTAMHGLVDRGRCQPGETVVVTGAAGGAGQAAVEIAQRLGARVIAVVSSSDKLSLTQEIGADDGILYPGTDLKARVRELTGGRGADIVYDCIGGDAAEPLVRALAWQGRFLVVGFAAGDIPRIPLNLLLLKGADVCGVFWGEAVKRAPDRHRESMVRVLDWVARGELKPRIHGTFPLHEIRAGLAVLTRREARGKVVLTV